MIEIIFQNVTNVLFNKIDQLPIAKSHYEKKNQS